MLNKLLHATAVVAGLSSLAPGTAHADIMWSLSDITFGDGGTGTGSFDTNASGEITAWDITTTNGLSLSGATYDNTAAGSNVSDVTSSSFEVSNTTPAQALQLNFELPLVQSNTPDGIIGGGTSFEVEINTGASRRILTGEAIAAPPPTSAPEPSTLASTLAGLGMLGLVFLWRRRRRIFGPAIDREIEPQNAPAKNAFTASA